MPLPLIDVSRIAEYQTVIASGKTEYQGHPTTVSMPDGKTLYCVWTVGHGGPCGPFKRSSDGGKSWGTLLPMPENWKEHGNCPSIWHLPEPESPNRLCVYAQEPVSRRMTVSCSDDGGLHWSPMVPCGEIVSVMPWTTIIPVEHTLLGMTNARDPGNPAPDCNRIIRSYSTDNGRNWTGPEAVTHLPDAKLCEPWIIPSPDGRELACLLRTNNRKYSSMVMFSTNRGETWSTPTELPLSLKGDRHIARYLPDGRIMAVFRVMDEQSEIYRHFGGWIGSWEDLKNGLPGEARLKLLHHFPVEGKFTADCGYPGLEVLPDGTVLATTYLHYHAEDPGNSVVAVKLPLSSLSVKSSAGLMNVGNKVKVFCEGAVHK